ncbi:RagB/SusD family nutrient uptake outer membrane protein [Lutibacter flavus]|uniref:Starch-binding associating with outer membrane n=1 Tax=Lutibacter flavus TaxID=691689 RepID=A0A238YVL7_9FLAO|nr:RagB/SusD family nutrient uptake outer membrane protein [Lutibacter flavus]SNR74771.1 Starch-binding associating with outer membrane [Lutibacter flavus]
MKINRINKIIKTCLYLLFFITISSCDDDLTEELKGDLSISTLTTESDAIALIDGIHNGMFDDGWGYYGAGVMARATDGITDVFKISDIHYAELEKYQWSNENIVAPIWVSIYKVIDRANWALQLIEGMDDSYFGEIGTKNKLLGEASFLRGMAYFDLVGMFGGVPLKLEPTTTDIPGLSRSSASDVYVQIEKDLEFAIANLPANGSSPGRASKGAAYGILAKAQLRQLKWAEAGENIDALIALGVYDLFTEDSFLKLFYESKILDNEFIFSILSMGESYSTASNHHVKFFTPWSYDTGWANVGLPPTIYNTIEEGDERLEVYLDDYPQLYGGALRSAIDQFGFAINRKFGHYNRDVTAPGTGYDAYKNYGISKLGVPVLRYADVLLLKADIENELNGPNGEAYEAINQVRNRSGLGNLQAGLSKEDFRDAVLKERAIELAGEGHRKDDLIRHGLFESTMTRYLSDQGYPVNVTVNHQLMPIPRLELDLNPNMEPNPSNNF